ncbi:transporter substrate-binding domain-containing protein [Roseibium suaedae]|uniref:ABC-type amino acid transport substrate-binding protein n=1 Tax=Roseibium suaedae TaxID=735517 RepID=A0A1M7KM63_9HYPH|nr:transporter substrate-binding domain-containing protein [Roseibium suaedae]SHM66492.1 ABC-type amino acid transport substrate-binding protein [Roseibium suaedae]
MPRRLLSLLLLALMLLPQATAATAQPASALVEQARADAAPLCGSADRGDRLFDILCDGVIRVGVRNGYSRFATERQGIREGFEIDVAEQIGALLGVDVEFIDVTPVTRISALSDGQIDLVIATMGHNSTRDANARFIRPHYYSSQTVIIGPRRLEVTSWDAMADKTVCTTVGNYANTLLVPRVARVMLFDTPDRLVSNLRSGTCTFIAQDDSVLANAMADPEIAAQFDRKLGFGEIPWGMAVSLQGSDKLGDLLDRLSIDLHASGILLEIARQHSIETEYLLRMETLWQRDDCQAAPSKCLAPPLKAELSPSPFKAFVDSLYAWAQENLSVFFSEVAWDLFTNGMLVSLIAVAGAMVATLVMSFLFALCLTSESRLLKWPLSVLLAVLQSSPPILILVCVAAAANQLFSYSQVVALLVAILSIALMNGAFAGQAIADAWRSVDTAEGKGERWRQAIIRSASQIEAFLTNATRGISAASFVGVADLTNALNDITSFSRNQATTYWILLIFYVLVVMVVVRLSRRLRVSIERLEPKG